MHDEIYLPYHHMDLDGRAMMPWHPPHMPRRSMLEENLGFDRRLLRVQDSSMVSHGRWLYELNWFDQATGGMWSRLDNLLQYPQLCRELERGSGFLLANLSFEANVPDPTSLLAEIHANGIDPTRVIWGTGSHAAVRQVERLGLPFKPLTIRASESMSSAWLADRTKALPDRAITRRFICFMRRYRGHRFKLLTSIIKAGLLDQFFISFPQQSEGRDAMQAAEWLCASMPDADDIIGTIGMLYDRLPLLIDAVDHDINLCEHQLSDAALPWFMHSGISVVSETLFDSPEPFVSEKSYHPIRYRQPFIVVGPPGTLRALRDDGYETFSAWWDESYDDEPDHEKRMAMLITLISDLAGWSHDRFDRMLRDTIPTCAHNIDLLARCHTRPNHVTDLSSIWS